MPERPNVTKVPMVRKKQKMLKFPIVLKVPKLPNVQNANSAKVTIVPIRAKLSKVPKT